MPECAWISLITDFGVDSPFVGVMKAAIWSRANQARIVDIFHNVAPYHVDEGGFWLARTYHYLPEGSVHVAVVDPGVGSSRRILAARHAGHLFLAPDNGLFDQAFAGHAVIYRELDLPVLARSLAINTISSTFHGRDIFAPVAAALANGSCAFEALGPERGDIAPSALGAARRVGQQVHGVVISIDHYGNLITNIDATHADGAKAQLLCAGHRFNLRRTYADARAGEGIALVNSFGVFEIARAQGNAAVHLGISRGAQVVLTHD